VGSKLNYFILLLFPFIFFLEKNQRGVICPFLEGKSVWWKLKNFFVNLQNQSSSSWEGKPLNIFYVLRGLETNIYFFSSKIRNYG